MKLSKSQLQDALDGLAAANNRALTHRNKIMAHCLAVYGVEPGDVDNDAFIDSVDGGCGACNSMSWYEFHLSMENAMWDAGVCNDKTNW